MKLLEINVKKKRKKEVRGKREEKRNESKGREIKNKEREEILKIRMIGK